MRARGRWLAMLAALTCAVLPRDARAHCRTTTCRLPPNFAPTGDSCYPDGFESYCAGLDPPARVLPVFWRNACVSYDIQKDASVEVPYPIAAQMFEVAFSKWTSTICSSTNDAGVAAWGRVSIDVRDFGPVACDKVQFNTADTGQGNQHVIVFYDHDWPHGPDATDILGLTTISFDPETGELFDADMEINATVPLSLADPVPARGYDFESIIAHETGHFLGMAHSGQMPATMTASYQQGSTWMRTLRADDQAGVCAIYHPDGNRAVAPGIGPGALLIEDGCDPTPDHGFQSACGQASGGCDVGGGSGVPSRDASMRFLAGLATLALGGARYIRRRRAGPARM